MTLSVVVITKNEAHNIAACFETVQWADERILVDAASSDQTVKIASEIQPLVRVFTRSWQGFGRQKNFGITQTSSDWILILDADERVPSDLQREIRTLLNYSDHNIVAYRIPRRNFLWGHLMCYGGMYPDYQIRLFQKGVATYNDVPVHENLIVNGAIGALRSPLDHYPERCINDHFIKMDMYTTLAAEWRLATRSSVSWYRILFNPLGTLCKIYFLKQGIRDGVAGLINSLFSSMYTFLKYAKLWEMSRDTYQSRQTHNKPRRSIRESV